MGESSELIQSSGGIFEVELDGQLIFSKKKENRFPEDDEVAKLVNLLNQGTPLEQAQEQAGKDAKKPPSFGKWFQALIHKR